MRYLGSFVASLLLLIHQHPEARVVAAVSGYVLNAAGANPPPLLSQAGLYRNILARPRLLTDSIHPFEVNSPLWSDGSHKERFIQVPFGARIIPTDTAKYAFPDGTVLIKNFSIDTVDGDTNTRILIETRFLTVRSVGSDTAYSGLTYRWRRDQTDAELVVPDGEKMIHNVRVGGVLKGKRWHYPGRQTCNECHEPSRRGSLGFITPQLNRPVRTNPSLNQLQDLFNKGVLARNPVQGKPNAHRWRAVEDEKASLEVRARSYFGANCSHCHGNNEAKVWGNHSFDYFDPAKTIIYSDSTDEGREGYVGVNGGYNAVPLFIYPGRPDSSYILLRMLSRGTFDPDDTQYLDQMPPLATYQIDSTAVKVVRDWVCNMKTPATPASSCKVPDVKYAPFAEPASIHRNFPAHRPGLRASFNNGELRVWDGHTAASVSIGMFDSRGRRVDLVPRGPGRYRVPAPLRSGLYFVKAGSQVLRLNRLP